MSTYYGIMCETCQRGDFPFTPSGGTFEKNQHGVCDMLIKYHKRIIDIMERLGDLSCKSYFHIHLQGYPLDIEDVLEFMYKHKGHVFCVIDEYGNKHKGE